MPNVKIFVDETLYPACRAGLGAALGPMRDYLCAEFRVDVPACQFAVLPVLAMPDLPRVNIEIQILPRADRTRDRVTAIGQHLRDMVAAVTGTHVAIRISGLDPETYIALK